MGMARPEADFTHSPRADTVHRRPRAGGATESAIGQAGEVWRSKRFKFMKRGVTEAKIRKGL